MNLVEWLRDAERRLTIAGVDTPRLDAQIIAAHVMGTDRSWVLAHPELPFNPFIYTANEKLERRKQREPLAYILGWREFYGRQFVVNPRVLIPRQETELLVEEAIRIGDCRLAIVNSGERDNRQSTIDDRSLLSREGGLSVLDLGTGSGCIAITLKLEKPEWSVAASDISAEALHLARFNAESLGADVAFIRSDLFDQWDQSDGSAGLGDAPLSRFDLIVTNPPYVSEEEKLMPELAYEPRNALMAGPEGLCFHERLAIEAPKHLLAGGTLLTEIGAGQAGPVRGSLPLKGGGRFEQFSILRASNEFSLRKARHS